MLKLLLALIIVIIIALLLYRRARPYLIIARRVYQLFRQVRQFNINQTFNERDVSSTTNRGSQVSDKRNAARNSQTTEKLLRCASCGTWTPASRAVTIQNTTFCSHACLERRADSSTDYTQEKSAS